MNFVTPAFERLLADNNIAHRVEQRGVHHVRILFDHDDRTLVVASRVGSSLLASAVPPSFTSSMRVEGDGGTGRHAHFAEDEAP